MKTNADIKEFSESEWDNEGLNCGDWVPSPKDTPLDQIVMSEDLTKFIDLIKQKLRYQVEFSVHRRSSMAGSRYASGHVIAVQLPDSNLITTLIAVPMVANKIQEIMPQYEIFSPRIHRDKRVHTNTFGHMACGMVTANLNKAAKLVASFAPVSDAELVLVSIDSIKDNVENLLRKPRHMLEGVATREFTGEIGEQEKKELLLALEHADKNQVPLVLDESSYTMKLFRSYKEERDKQMEKLGYIGEQEALYVVQTYRSSALLVIARKGTWPDLTHYCTYYVNVEALPIEVRRPLSTLDMEGTRPELQNTQVQLEGVGYSSNSSKHWNGGNPYALPLYAVFVDPSIHETGVTDGELMSDAF